MRHFGMVCMRSIKLIRFPFTDICRKRFAVIMVACRFFLFLGFPFSNKISKPGIRTGRIIGGVTQFQNIVIGAKWETNKFTKISVF